MFMSGFPYKIIDLTHTLRNGIPAWDDECSFNLDVVCDYADCDTSVKFRAQFIKMNTGLGTHMDAPSHCTNGGLTIDQIALENLVAPCVVIDVSDRADGRYKVSLKDIEDFESAHGRIPPRSFVMLRTGWGKYWGDPQKYRNDYRFPSLSGQAATFLLTRDIVGIGIDSLSPDRPEDDFIVHATLLGAGKFMVENVANADALPSTGSFVMALPIKTGGATESPVRMIGLIPEAPLA